MEQLTPSQKNQLKAWSAQRDALLGDLVRLDSEKEEKEKKVLALADSKTVIEHEIGIAEGRLIEIEQKVSAGFEVEQTFNKTMASIC